MDRGESSSCSDPSGKLLAENTPGYSKVKSSYVEIVSLEQGEQVNDSSQQSPVYHQLPENQQQEEQPQQQQQHLHFRAPIHPPLSKDDTDIDYDIYADITKNKDYLTPNTDKNDYDIYKSNTGQESTVSISDTGNLEKSQTTGGNTGSPMETDRNSGEMKEEEEITDDNITETADPSVDLCEYKKPKFSYAQLIIQAIHSFPGEQATLSQVYDYITRTYPYYQMKNKGWQNSVRHNLSLNCYFIRTPAKYPQGIDTSHSKGGYWRLNPLYSKKLVEEGFNQKRNRKLPPLYLRKNEIPYYYLNENEKFKSPSDFINYRFYEAMHHPSLNNPHSIDNILNPKGACPQPSEHFHYVDNYGTPCVLPNPANPVRNKQTPYYEHNEFAMPHSAIHPSEHTQPHYRFSFPHPHMRDIPMMRPQESPLPYGYSHPDPSTHPNLPPPLTNMPNIDMRRMDMQQNADSSSYAIQQPSILDYHNYRQQNTQDNPSIIRHQPHHSYYPPPLPAELQPQQEQQPAPSNLPVTSPYPQYNRQSFPSSNNN